MMAISRSLCQLCSLLVILNVNFLADPVEAAKIKCGYESCPKTKEGFINIHLVPHTHDDVGWIKTPDQYFFGSKLDIVYNGVQYILDGVVNELKDDPKKRFIYVETAFFWQWWQRQDAKTRSEVQKLVHSGRLEFIGGGWSMHDEATTHYQSIIDGFTWGFRKLNDTFGECSAPRIGWQIDPFGHARETASIMARLGFDALLFGRADYRDIDYRKLQKHMQMVWEASPNIGDEADLLTGITFDGYYPPDGFCFDIECGEPPIIDDRTSPEFNADKLIDSFLSSMYNYSQVFRGSHLLVPMGGDFNYLDPHYYFKNVDLLIKNANARQDSGSKYNLLYSTPSCFVKALNDQQFSWPTKQDDFFPYASNAHSYWTGFYTSRPALKRYERIGNNYLQVCKQLFSLADLGSEEQRVGGGGDISTLREAMGVLQHHDAISGTEQQHVAFDYARRLSFGFDQCNEVVETALNKLLAKSASSDAVGVQNCPLLNVSQCAVSETEGRFVVTLYNPLSRVVSRYIRLPISDNGKAYKVYDYKGKLVKTQVVPVPSAVQNVPGRTSKASQELVFQAADLPPLGFLSFYVTNTSKGGDWKPASEHVIDEQITIGFPGSMQLSIDTSSGLPTGLKLPGDSDFSRFTQNFGFYNSFVGDNEVPENQSSGAYLFRPAQNYSTPVAQMASLKYYKGSLVEEVQQTFSDWVSQVIRAYQGEDHLEFNWLIGPLPHSEETLTGVEVVTQYSLPDMHTESTFYTDSNGREMLQRVLNYRSTFNLTSEEPIAGNYYPVTTRISLKDTQTQTQISVNTDRAQGGSSLLDGQMELMLHRRTLRDDSLGVGEPLNETAFNEGLVVRGTHYLTGGPAVNQSAVDRRLVQARVMDAWTFLTPTSLSIKQWQANYNMQYTGLQSALPENVQILTLEPWTGTSFLLRLEHILEANDDQSAAQPVVVNLQDIFQPFTITWVRETSLGANQWLDEMTRLVWKKEDSSSDQNVHDSAYSRHPTLQDVPTVTLTPMAIKTFIIQVAYQ